MLIFRGHEEGEVKNGKVEGTGTCHGMSQGLDDDDDDGNSHCDDTYSPHQ